MVEYSGRFSGSQDNDKTLSKHMRSSSVTAKYSERCSGSHDINKLSTQNICLSAVTPKGKEVVFEKST